MNTYEINENPLLPERVRPQKIEDIAGQDHLLAPGAPLYSMIKSGHMRSMILWGAPGTGKTTIAQLIAQETNLPFFALSAALIGVAEIRAILEKSARERAILFLDEIHRFNKSQQDILLYALEKGSIILIGATTENPSFEVNKALLSRCRLFVLKPLDEYALVRILENAIKTDALLQQKKIVVEETDMLFAYAEGDARRMLNAVEALYHIEAEQETIVISNKTISETLQKKSALYDKKGEEHYNVISAFIKSIRGSDPNAAVYWLSRMLVAGEDILFIARRMIILSAEDIGLANPTALILANAAFDAVHKIGMPEARIILSQCAIYLAASPKSNSAYKAIESALNVSENKPAYATPLHLRNPATSLMKEMQYGKFYAYVHDFEPNFVDQEYMPKELEGTVFYTPQDNERERQIKDFIDKHWKEKYST